MNKLYVSTGFGFGVLNLVRKGYINSGKKVAVVTENTRFSLPRWQGLIGPSMEMVSIRTLPESSAGDIVVLDARVPDKGAKALERLTNFCEGKTLEILSSESFYEVHRRRALHTLISKTKDVNITRFDYDPGQKGFEENGDVFL